MKSPGSFFPLPSLLGDGSTNPKLQLTSDKESLLSILPRQSEHPFFLATLPLFLILMFQPDPVKPSLPFDFNLEPTTIPLADKERLQAFYDSLPKEMATELAKMVEVHAARAPVDAIVSLVLRPLPEHLQVNGKRKFEVKNKTKKQRVPGLLNTYFYKRSTSSIRSLSPSLTRSALPTRRLLQLKQPRQQLNQEELSVQVCQLTSLFCIGFSNQHFFFLQLLEWKEK